MSLTVLAWLAVAAYALHVVEEHMLGWFDWARRTMNITWEQYVVTELAILVLGVVAAMLSAQPIGQTLVVAFATMLVINALFFHLLAMLRDGGRFSPGIISGLILFLPVAWLIYRTQTLPQNELLWAAVLGAALMGWPVMLSMLKSQRYFSGAPAKATKRKR